MSGQVCGSFPAEAKQELAGFQQITAKLKVLQQGCSVLSFWAFKPWYGTWWIWKCWQGLGNLRAKARDLHSELNTHKDCCFSNARDALWQKVNSNYFLLSLSKPFFIVGALSHVYCGVASTSKRHIYWEFKSRRKNLLNTVLIHFTSQRIILMSRSKLSKTWKLATKV